HRVVQRTFAAAGFETRILHPFVTKQYRQPVDPGTKTDDTDLAAIHRATVTGCALLEATRDEAWTTLLLLIRQRRDLVRKGAALNCQIRDHLEAALPGYAACFDKLWESPIPWHLLQRFPTAAQLRDAGLTTLGHSLRQAGVRFQRRTVQAVLDWAQQPAPGHGAARRHRRTAILAVADNLILCNHPFQALATQWTAQGKDPRHTHVKVALRFCRIAFQMVAGRQVFRHPSMQGRHYVLDKLTAFHREHDTGMVEVLRDLQAAIGQVPRREHAAEAKPLQEELHRIHDGRRRGPQVLGDILPNPLGASGGRRGTIARVRGVDLRRTR